MITLKGKNALVTGAAAGIGRGIVKALAQQGANVIITDKPGVDLDPARIEAAEFGSEILTIHLDVGDQAMIDSVAEEVISKWGHVDILASNAGINTCEDTLSIGSDSWDKHFNVNVRGGFFLAQKLIPGMIENNWGRIIFTASQAAIVGRPNQAAYCATKGALTSLTRSLALDYAKYNITVNAVAPTFVLTDISRERMKNPEFEKWVKGMIPIGRLATTENVGNTVAFLASEEAEMTTGHVLTVDGGWTIQ